MLEFLQSPAAQSFALYAGAAGTAAAIGLARDARAQTTLPARRESLLVPLGLAALAVAFAAGASEHVRLLAGGLLLTGLFLIAIAPRQTDRDQADRGQAGRRVGSFFSWTAIAIALVSAFIRHQAPPDLPT